MDATTEAVSSRSLETAIPFPDFPRGRDRQIRARSSTTAAPIRVVQFDELQQERHLDARLKDSPFSRRIRNFQKRWRNIEKDLPPQLTSRHIGMISIGGVIGTGLFLGSADALYHGGPIGALMGYSIIGSVVYCLCVSIGEMISYLPNVGGVVGIADLYVDPALGFSLGWASWYSWTIALPSELTAAVVLVGFWDSQRVLPIAALISIFLAVNIGINCFPSRVYGELEFWLSSIKVLTIVFLIITSIVLDLGAGKQGLIGFENWSQPFSDSYLGLTGSTGRFLHQQKTLAEVAPTASR